MTTHPRSQISSASSAAALGEMLGGAVLWRWLPAGMRRPSLRRTFANSAVNTSAEAVLTLTGAGTSGSTTVSAAGNDFDTGISRSSWNTDGSCSCARPGRCVEARISTPYSNSPLERLRMRTVLPAPPPAPWGACRRIAVVVPRF